MAEDPFYQPIGLKFKEETTEMVHLVHSFVRNWNWYTSENKSEILESYEMCCW